ncbi:family 16 glycoside hydrolase [Silvibacterium dinghuense]|uniref:DUF1080 domain-containing protein n=1 Tax=Silvibacterium dinghuense TaxID=1560006 RepID=A0A4Q1SIK1_9BACT|nr:family 16 glycoside hydrolase [Silvibacterium dinghuense]RXS97434.1 DUF1080 domain-containing protein [Silvibacterium dinghuense]GGG98994.1 hypothetical protein GCM10011586_13090 [Silvibacterium dinghuense]
MGFRKSSIFAWLWFSVAGLLVVLTGAPARAQAPLKLFNGTSLLGWNQHGGWNVSGGAITAGGSGERTLISAVPFGEMNLEFEYNASGSMGSKLRLWTDRDGSGGFTIDLDPSGASAGVGGIETLSNSSIATLTPGWHRVQVEAAHGHINVKIDGLPSGNAGDLGTRAGYIGFTATGEGSLQIRGVKVAPLGLSKSFNGTDLSGWKSIAQAPNAKGGVGHDLAKTFTFGIGGGSTKPHEAKWSVVSGAIHGVDGPGGLEYSNNLENGIVQITAHGTVKSNSTTVLSVRTSPGQLSGGYEVGIGPNAGQINGLAPHPQQGIQSIDQTIVFSDRTLAVWIDGSLVTVYTDTRAENASPLKGAKTSGGALTLLLPAGDEINVSRMFYLTLSSKLYGAPAHTPPPPVVAAAPQTQPATAPPPPASEAEKAILAQQQAATKKDAEDQANKKKVAALMAHALSTNDPQQQLDDYGQVVQIDPYNAVAVQGYKDAQARIQASQQAQEHAANEQVNQQQEAQNRAVQTSESLQKARMAFLNGRISEASSALAVAEKLSPGNPAVHDLRSRLSAAQAVRSRLYFLGGGAGLVGILGLAALWMRRSRQQRFPHLEVKRGFEVGRSYPIEKDTVRIGAVPQNGTYKNDIVLQDIEHTISRFHCEVSRKNGQLYITDLKSANGTLVDGEPLQPGQPRLLRRGNTITLANNVELRFDYGRRPAGQA